MWLVARTWTAKGIEPAKRIWESMMFFHGYAVFLATNHTLEKPFLLLGIDSPLAQHLVVHPCSSQVGCFQPQGGCNWAGPTSQAYYMNRLAQMKTMKFHMFPRWVRRAAPPNLDDDCSSAIPKLNRGEDQQDQRACSKPVEWGSKDTYHPTPTNQPATNSASVHANPGHPGFELRHLETGRCASSRIMDADGNLIHLTIDYSRL